MRIPIAMAQAPHDTIVICGDGSLWAYGEIANTGHLGWKEMDALPGSPSDTDPNSEYRTRHEQHERLRDVMPELP